MTEKLKNKSESFIKGKNGGRRPGAGRKRGGKNEDTLIKERELAEYKKMIQRNADKLFNAQMTLALGTTYVYRIEETVDKKGNTKRKSVLVTDPEEIARIIENGGAGADFYKYTVKDPDNNAIKDMLDRAFGRPTQTIEQSGAGAEAVERLASAMEMIAKAKNSRKKK